MRDGRCSDGRAVTDIAIVSLRDAQSPTQTTDEIVQAALWSWREEPDEEQETGGGGGGTDMPPWEYNVAIRQKWRRARREYRNEVVSASISERPYDMQSPELHTRVKLTLRVSFGSLLIGRRPDQLGPTSQSTSGMVVPST
ncbi:hypothetical protein NUW54_g11215 [Trametes sanguinea]|uniref:Uncharacterized protein n=1 Tax=Trametes sanguinea TaxID=158606 RepID=A0ACC1NIR2_9APHY|nr:hypothetical protein NUW54_g11215 [Trametes sanguinea]